MAIKLTELVMCCLLHVAGNFAEEIIGIDLGTTFIRVGIIHGGVVHVIPNELGNKKTPSYITFTENGVPLIGEISKGIAEKYPTTTIYHIKRFIGRTGDDPFVKRRMRAYPFSIINIENKPHIKIVSSKETYLLTPEEITALFLKQMKTMAEEYIGKTVSEAVITTPSYFNEAQRQATIDAAKIAGLNVLRILSEPTAAALGRVIHKADNDHIVCVLDFGGGTVDVSIIEIHDFFHEVKATVGNTTLGGEDFTDRIYDKFVEVYSKTKGKLFSKVKYGHQLKKEAERAKLRLSSSSSVVIELMVDNVEDRFQMELNRSQFEEICRDLLQSIFNLVKDALLLSKYMSNDITEVVIVGGSSEIPFVYSMMYKTFKRTPYKSDHPDEAVVHGATIQASILEKKEKNITLTDVYPYTLGIETEGRKYSKVVLKNSNIPMQTQKEFSLSAGGKNALVKIYRGDSDDVKNNVYLGHFTVEDTNNRRGIVVHFEIDVNGIITVSASYPSVFSYKPTAKLVLKGGLNKMPPDLINKKRKIVNDFWIKHEKRILEERARSKLEEIVYRIQYAATQTMKWLDKRTKLNADVHGLKHPNTSFAKYLQHLCDELQDIFHQHCPH